MSSLLKIFISKFSALIFPHRCPFCLALTDSEHFACDKCKKDIPANGVFQGVGGYRCCSALLYHGKFKQAVLRFKFKGKTEYAKPFARLIYDEIKRSYPDTEFDYITYVPMYKKDEKKRGYNQCELIANELSELTGIECIKALNKKKHTKPQHKLPAKERKTNLKGAFEAVNIYKVENSTILLLDDIVTTGSTLSECAKTLQKAKPAQICCATLISVANLY